LPITLLTGFLGSGKTTLLNRLVRSPELSNAVVIINELGEISIDHLLVEKAEGGLLTLSSGCLCCTVRGDMVSTLEDLLRQRDNGRMPAFDRVVVETTGLADPAPILNTIVVHPYLVLRYRIDGVITVVDAVNGAATLDAHREAVQQVAVADSLVLTKTDLCADRPEALAGLRHRLAVLNPAADLLDAGEASASVLLAANLFRNADRLQESDHAGHDHHDHAGHDHAHGPHDEQIGSFVLTADGPLQPAAFEMFIDLLRASGGATLLRVKGLVGLADDPERPLVIQGVQHLFHPPRRLPAWPDADRRSRLVMIGRDLDRAAVERLWTAFFAAPTIDRPDGAALAAPFADGGAGLV
jgi:G3E family GTPase